MMPYVVALDPDTGELLVGDMNSSTFFLYGQPEDERAIRDLVQAANERMHAKSEEGE